MAPWEEINAIPYGVELGGIIRGRFLVISKRRPTGFPKGAAAIRRQLGTDLTPCPASSAAGRKNQSSPVWGHITCSGE